MTTRIELEAALDAGKLFVHMRNGAKWKARRNGATKLWKRDPDNFRIPFKCGLYVYGAFDPSWLVNPADLFTIEA